MSARVPLVYTFGNHMHWVDMQWLWGYEVMPGSTRDMLKFCAETGAKGNVNFDGVGYEKMAAEAPEALAELRAAIEHGQIEPVGCSYGQPYGLFHGGESNIRQRVHGARTVRRLLGVWPTTFWEEEFDFFPQLPQMLRGAGFESASLYFQWTWHTPEVPRDAQPVVWWEGVDGSRLKCATRNALNLHQWPEDFQILLDDLATLGPEQTLRNGANAGLDDGAARTTPLVLQWLELMPSPDWMCRSELMIPKLKELASDPRFALTFATLGEYLASAPDDVPVRRIGLNDVWHGFSIGKNGDRMRALSANAERQLVQAEMLATLTSLLPRPYAQWDVYPVWTLEEAWRELLQAQHHDNDECEGLCGEIGEVSYAKASSLAELVTRQQSVRLSTWPCEWVFELVNPDQWTQEGAFCQEIGLRAGERESHDPHTTLKDDSLEVNAKAYSASIRQDGIEWNLASGRPGPIDLVGGLKIARRGANGDSSVRLGDLPVVLNHSKVWWSDGDVDAMAWFESSDTICMNIYSGQQRPEPGIAGGFRLELPARFEIDRIYADSPYAIEEAAFVCGSRKYPEGDWMTSPQWFETVEPITFATSFIDLVAEDGSGVMIVHDRPRAWFRNGNSMQMLLSMHDPWDDNAFHPGFMNARAEFKLIPHGRWTHRQRWLRAQAAYFGPEAGDGMKGEPVSWTPFKLHARGTAITALYREAEGFSGRHLDDYAGAGMGYPFVMRLVEWNGEPDETVVEIEGTVAAAFRTDLLGHIQERLMVEQRGGRSFLNVAMRPREIATLYLDIVEGRKVPRDLDAHRDVWATVHRRDES